jgi:hypothetical protein
MAPEGHSFVLLAKNEQWGIFPFMFYGLEAHSPSPSIGIFSALCVLNLLYFGEKERERVGLQMPEEEAANWLSFWH